MVTGLVVVVVFGMFAFLVLFFYYFVPYCKWCGYVRVLNDSLVDCVSDFWVNGKGGL
jgi:hypothetical protein